MSNPLFKLDITEDYDDLPLIRHKDEYSMIVFVEGGFRNSDFKALNFVRKFLQAVTLSDISTADGTRISIQAYEVVVGNGLRKGIKLPMTPTKEEIPASFITLWQSAIDKCFVNNCSNIKVLITNSKKLGGWTDQDINDK